MTDRQPPPHTSVVYRVGGTDYPMRVHGRCRTCKSIHRAEIENLILMGYSWSTIAEHLPESSGLPSSSIRWHYDNGHMPLPESLRRAVIERRAKMQRLSSADNAAPLIDPWLVTHDIMQRGYERMVTGQIAPDMKDLLAAAKALVEIEDRTKEAQQINEDAVVAIIEGARSYMSPEDWMKFMWELKENPAMNLLATDEPEEALAERSTQTALPPVGDRADQNRNHQASSRDFLPLVIDDAETVY
jgi:hypothetical protein